MVIMLSQRPCHFTGLKHYDTVMQRKTHSQHFFLRPAPSRALPVLHTHLSSHSFCTEHSASSLSPTSQSCEEKGEKLNGHTTSLISENSDINSSQSPRIDLMCYGGVVIFEAHILCTFSVLNTILRL